MRAIAVVGWLWIVGALLVWQGIGLVRGPEWPTLSDFFRSFMTVPLGVERVPRVAGVRDGFPVLDNGRILEVANVIWCTGYHHDFDWIDLRVHRDLPQPQATAQCARDPHADRFREDAPLPVRRGMSQTSRLHGTRGTSEPPRFSARFRPGAETEFEVVPRAFASSSWIRWINVLAEPTAVVSASRDTAERVHVVRGAHTGQADPPLTTPLAGKTRGMAGCTLSVTAGRGDRHAARQGHADGLHRRD